MGTWGITSLFGNHTRQYKTTASSCTKVDYPEKEENWFENWIDDKDKISTDGNDDGHISLKESAGSFGKGLMGIVKTAANHPKMTWGAVLGGTAAVVLTGGAMLPIFVAAGIATGVGQVGYGSYKAATAKTDGEAKQGWETMGYGAFTGLTSAFSAGKITEVANGGFFKTLIGAHE